MRDVYCMFFRGPGLPRGHGITAPSFNGVELCVFGVVPHFPHCNNVRRNTHAHALRQSVGSAGLAVKRRYDGTPWLVTRCLRTHAHAHTHAHAELHAQHGAFTRHARTHTSARTDVKVRGAVWALLLGLFLAWGQL